MKSSSFTTPTTSTPSSSCKNNKKYSRPTGRNVAKAALSSCNNKRKYKQEPVSCTKDKEIKKLKMAFEHRNEQVERRNTQNTMKYVIELYKDDEANKEQIQILKNKLLEDTLKTIALNKESMNAKMQESGVPESDQFDSNNTSLSSEEEITITHNNISPANKNSVAFIGLGKLAELACNEEKESM